MPIINGVEVEECYFYYNGECRCELNCIDLKNKNTIKELFYRPTEYIGDCAENENCYYKQLKRLEQENENLKQQLEIDKNQINYFIEENKRLSELTCVNCGEKYLSPDGSELYEENERLKENIEDLAKDLQVQNRIIGKFERILQEIKEIAEHEIKELTDSAINNGRYLEILDLITKAEEE